MRILGIDYGEKRVGLAISDLTGTIATPYKVLQIRGMRHAIELIREDIAELEPELIVVGLPLNMNGTQGPSAELALKLQSKLIAKTGLPVETYDERLSTVAAERVLIDADVSRKKRKKVIDKMAAAIILQSYLDYCRMRNDD
jgi:putative pre-16S rRNA nuclease